MEMKNFAGLVKAIMIRTNGSQDVIPEGVILGLGFHAIYTPKNTLALVMKNFQKIAPLIQ